MSIGSFSIIRNEARWVAANLIQILPFIDEVVLFDGNSTDGTIEIIEAIQRGNRFGSKIRLFKDRDVKDLEFDYEKVSNECMRTLTTDWAMFLHPDMFVENPDAFISAANCQGIAQYCNIRSFAGDPDGDLKEIAGRAPRWKNIYRLRNPDMGAHYHGFYGAWNEDTYFSQITGDSYDFHGNDFHKYPYFVEDSRLRVLHFSDVRPYERRLSRMVSCLMNGGCTHVQATEMASAHPRVTHISDSDMTFKPSRYPSELLEFRAKYHHLEKEPANAR